ncbi:MAG TPA: MFS transporter, partial [Chthonomonadales bacterium]|nr:MFS transporter [Chthonomonadales bacterium]
DFIGMGTLIALAALGHAVGILATILAHGFGMLFFGTLAIGIANGLVEAACNPLIAGLYPDQKIKRLNLFHMWFPGGIVIGGLAAFAVSKLVAGPLPYWEAISWKVKMMTMIPPLLVYVLLFRGAAFPKTERVSSGVHASEMYQACVRPFFLLFVLCMLMTAATELVSEQWLPNIMTFVAAVSGSGILYLVWINGLMAIGRSMAGHIVARISPILLLMLSAAFSAAGTFMLSQAHSKATAEAAATIFAIGVCYFWPTMLGVVNERFPKTGAVGLAIMGGAGNFSVSLFLPIFGGIYQTATIKAAGGARVWNILKNAPNGTKAIAAQAAGGAAALKAMTVLPAILLAVFTAIYLLDRMLRGGYRKEILGGEAVVEDSLYARSQSERAGLS